MCGIAGIWGQNDARPIEEMNRKQKHRGPDGEGLHVQEGKGVLGHVRLSIMDPEGGSQPIYNEDRSRVIVANGEIYNHADHRRRLVEHHRFGSTSDSETILHLFDENGPEAAALLDGMFAFAVGEADHLFLARDPIGIKPLYFAVKNENGGDNTIYFASELKAISRWTDDVLEFPAGTYYHSGKGFRRYYTVPQIAPEDLPPENLQVDELIRRVRESLEAAVVKRLMSDVPLGSFLSGGLDSSVIAAIARRHKDKLHTFSVGIEDSPDILAARQVADHIGSIHHEYIYTAKEIMEILPEVVYYLESFDQDLVRSSLPNYFCARLAANYVKVILTGEGADELFAGYDYYREYQNPDDLHRELHRSVTRLHNINLQRVDRMTMRHGIEGRVPFLDTNMIELAQHIPPGLKLYRTPDGRRIEKWILRKAVEDLLPHEIVWRKKEQFDQGSGTVDLLESTITAATSGIDFAEYAARYPRDRLRSTEECFYHRQMVNLFENPDPVLKNVARWSM